MKAGTKVEVNATSTYRRKAPNVGSYGEVVRSFSNAFGTHVYVEFSKVVDSEGRNCTPNTYWVSLEELDALPEAVFQLREMQRDLQDLCAKLDESDRKYEQLRREQANGN